jgi:CHAT domain-containing protein/lipopolysaccharide biosynthesis regulator YciM
VSFVSLWFFPLEQRRSYEIMIRSLATSTLNFRQTFRSCLLIILTICFYCVVPVGAEQAQPLSQAGDTLLSGIPVSRKLAGGEKHVWQIALSTGEYVQIVLEQRSIEVVVTLSDPDGGLVLKSVLPNVGGSLRPLSVNSLIAERSGIYTLEISPREPGAEPGSYEVKIEELRPALEADRYRINAQRLWTEGMGLKVQNSNEARRKALQKYEEALSILQQLGDRTAEAETLDTIGDIWYELTDAQKSFEAFDKALKIWEALGRRREEGTDLSQLGLICYVKFERKKTQEYYDRALEKHRATGDLFFEAETLNRFGWHYNAQGEKRRALEYHLQALHIRRGIGDRNGESTSLNDIGRAYADLGDVYEALEVYQQALKLRPPERNARGAANILNRIGIVYTNTSEWQKALDALNQALALIRQVDDKRAESAILSNTGYAFIMLGDTERALGYFEQALKLSRETELRAGEASILMAMGNAYGNAGEYQKAIECLNKAIEIQRAVRDQAGEALSLRSLGRFYNSKGDYQKGLEVGTQSLEKFRALGGNAAEASAFRIIAYSHDMLGNPEKALENYEQSLKLSRSTQERSGEALSLIDLGRLQRKMGNLAEARNLFERGIKIYESLRGRIVGQELRTSYQATLQNPYEQYIDLLMALDRKEPGAGHIAVALETSERTRARSLLDLLAETNAEIRQGADPSLLAKERLLQQRLNAKAAIQTKILGGKHSEEQATAFAKEITDLTNQLSDTVAQIRASSPRYTTLTQPEPLNLKEIQQQLDEKTVLLEFSLGAKQSWIWIVTPGEMASFELPPRNEIETAARKFYGLLTARQPNSRESSIQYAARVAEADAKIQTEATALSQMLLSPVADRLNLEWKGKRLVIVASGALDYLPFAALPVLTADAKTGDPYHPLIADHEIVNLPSASVLAAIRRESADRPKATKTLAILADPVFELNDPRVLMAMKKREPAGNLISSLKPVDASLIASEVNPELMRSVRSFNRSGFSPLPFSRIEAESISALIPQNRQLKAMGFKANREIATNGELARYRIVHFATHGLLNSEHPELSGLVLSLVDEDGKAQDGFLRMHEIYNLQLPADLVVLSACQTAIGKETKGEGLVGLTRGFMYAGAERVVASLWQVDDLATAELMKRFYRGMLLNKMRPAAALRAAQIEMMKQSRWASPYFWAAFLLQGEWK